MMIRRRGEERKQRLGKRGVIKIRRRGKEIE